MPSTRPGSPGEILVYQSLAQPKCFEYLSAAVALNGRDAHLRKDFDDTFHRRLDVVVNRGIVVDIDEEPVLYHLVQCLQRKIWIDRRSTKSNE